MKHTLLHKPIPFKNESPGSFLIRVSEINGWKTPFTLLNAYRPINKKIAPSLESTLCNGTHWNNSLHSLGFMKIDTLSICYKRYGPTIRSKVLFQDIPVPWNQLRIKKPAICPTCVCQKKHALSICDLKLITVCPIHQVKLLTACPECGDNFSWNRKHLAVCACGYNLESYMPTNADPTSAKFIEQIVNVKNTETLYTLFQLNEALKKFHELMNKPCNQQDLSLELLNFTYKAKKSISYIETLINTKMRQRGMHPRLSLFPFLLSDNKQIVQIAQRVLKRIKYEKPQSPHLPEKLSGNMPIKTAARTLGISLLQTKRLVKESVLCGTNEILKNKPPNLVSLDSINSLLHHFTVEDPLPSTPKQPQYKLTHKDRYKSFAILIKDAYRNGWRFRGANIMGKGLSEFSVCNKKVYKRPNHSSLTIRQTAMLCEVHPENIRFAVHCRVLKRENPEDNKGTVILISEDDAIRFNREYIFTGAIAKKYNCAPQNLAEKIMSLGIHPISGPRIDNGLTYLFKRAEIETINMVDVKKVTKYATKTGRKSNERENLDNSHSVSLVTAAELLNISVLKTKQLINKGILKESINSKRSISVTNKSIYNLISLHNDKRLISISDAIKITKETKLEFNKRWLSTAYVMKIYTGLDTLITVKDLKRIQKFKSRYITSSEAGFINNTHRTHLNNLNKRKVLHPSKKLRSGTQKVFFYDREEVIKLMGEPDAEP